MKTSPIRRALFEEFLPLNTTQVSCDEMSDTDDIGSKPITNQMGMPVVVTEMEIARERTLGGAISLCAKAAGFDLDKELQQDLDVDKGQFSRWLNGQEGIVWPKFLRLMDKCGNHAPVLWMLHQLGYDITSLRKRESELEKQLRAEQERRESVEAELAVLRKYVGVLK